MLTRGLVFVSLLQWVNSYMMFQQKIPNGNSAPYPCKPGKIWNGVGHILHGGTGTRNPFGRDFEAAGYHWTRDLCRKDSDGDGLYNGLELGDPDCVWKEGDKPKTDEGLSHPGICDPWDSLFCMRKLIISPKYETQDAWLKDMCQSEGLYCPALSDTSIRNVTIKLPPDVPVPPQITTYECQIFDLIALGVPQDRDYHMVAVTPIITSTDVVHHIVLFGCTGDTDVPPGPFECGMVPSVTCQDFLHVWTVGLDGECYHPDSGVRIGKSGYKNVAIQLHWNNAEGKAGRVDSSGLRMHYTPNLKPYDAGVFLVGSALFYLPPREEHVMVVSTCAGGCTKQVLRGSINITAAWNHMHYTGSSMIIEVKRNNEHLAYLTHDLIYSYDSPIVAMFSTPFELMPGDSLVTQCGYNTSTRAKTVAWGDATLDEMCFGFITYYPKQNMTEPYCLDKLGVSLCNPSSLGGCFSLGKFLMMINDTEVYKDVMSDCAVLNPCLNECVDTIIKYMRTEPCMKGQIWKFIQTQLAQATGPGHDFLCRLASCKAEVQMAMSSQLPPTDGTEKTVPESLTLLAVTIIMLQL